MASSSDSKNRIMVLGVCGVVTLVFALFVFAAVAASSSQNDCYITEMSVYEDVFEQCPQIGDLTAPCLGVTFRYTNRNTGKKTYKKKYVEVTMEQLHAIPLGYYRRVGYKTDIFPVEEVIGEILWYESKTLPLQ